MRRRHNHIDAVLAADPSGWVLTYWRNRRPMIAWRYTREDDARSEAAGRQQELHRAGWTSHW
jgi:hypothetical protein